MNNSLHEHYDNYCLLDFETTDKSRSFAKIIEISAIKVRNNTIVDTFSCLVNPRIHISREATAKNHITDEMVSDSLELDQIIDSFLEFIGTDVLVGYNISGFDIHILNRSLVEMNRAEIPNDYIDVMFAARRWVKTDDGSSSLESFCNHFGFDTTGEHRAEKDCILTKQLYDELYRQYDNKAFRLKEKTKEKNDKYYSEETKALQKIKKYIENFKLDKDNIFNNLDNIQWWIKNYDDLLEKYPFCILYDSLNKIVDSAALTEEEQKLLEDSFDEISDPLKNCNEKYKKDYLNGKTVCITGDFLIGSEPYVKELVESFGAKYKKSFVKSIDVLIVGALGSKSWKLGNYGGKILKTKELIYKGKKNVAIIKEGNIFQSDLKESK